MHRKEHHHKHEKDKENNNPFSEETVTDESLAKEENSADTQAEEISDELSKAKEEMENLNNQYVRLAADFDNYRKRQAQERESLLKYGAEETLKKLIEVIDNFERAKQSIENMEDVNQLKETFGILHKQFMDSLSKMGLESIETEGQKFDPALHEAVMQTNTEDYPEDTIIKELQKGYKLADKVIRAALVDVAVK